MKNEKPVQYSSDLFLDLEDDTFINIVMPPALQGLYSKSDRMVSMCGEFFRNMAYVHPRTVLPILIEEFYPALETVDQSHRMLSALGTLNVVCAPLLNRRLYPQGGTHLERLLWLVLPGIDSTDPMKTARTLSFMETVFHNVPFINAAESDQCEQEGENLPVTDNDDEVRSVSLMFGEWSVAFIKKLLAVIENLEDYNSAKKNQAQQMFLHLLQKVMDAFVSCLSKSIFEACLEEVKTYLIDNRFSAVIKYYGVVLGSFGFAQPAITLKSILPTFLSKLKQGMADHMAESDLIWFLYLTSQMIKRTGSAVLEYVPLLKEVSVQARGLENKDKKVSKYALRVIRGIYR